MLEATWVGREFHSESCWELILMSRTILFMAIMMATGSVAANSLPKKADAALQRVVRKDDVISVRDGPIKGWYEVELRGRRYAYVEKQGRGLVIGEWFDHLGRSVTEQRRSSAINEVFARHSQDVVTVVYEAHGDAQGLIRVFFDPTCGYCRKLHEEVPRLNEAGVTVVYYPLDRSGAEQNPTWKALSGILCGNNSERRSAFEDYLKGNSAPKPGCAANIGGNYRLFLEVDGRGTPAVFDARGRLIGGYAPAQALLDRMRQ